MFFRRRDLRLLAVLAGVFVALFLACLIFNIGAFLMRRMIHLAALAAAAIALSGCVGTGLLGGIDAGASPAVQKVQAESKAAVDKAIADRLNHCKVTGSLGAGIGGLAGTGTGLSTNLVVDCLPQPWSELPAIPAVATK